MFSRDEIYNMCRNFNIDCFDIGDLIDTSRNDDDRRYNYKINHQYFLKINNTTAVNEKFLSDIERLIKRYKSIGVYCPILYRTKEGKLSYRIEKEGIEYTCYVEELSPYPFYKSQGIEYYDFKKTVLEHLGILASKYTDEDLSETKSMWSLIELGPFDKDVDEKQENMDVLIKCLMDNGYVEIANKLFQLNNKARDRIKAYLCKLPCCVYQGDLNDSNILVDEDNKFRGIIDFNMFGTEVNINCFLNESMYFLEEQDFEKMSAKDIFSKMKNIQNSLLSSITANYNLNKNELEVVDDYKRIIFASFYPNVMLWINLITRHKWENKVIELLEIICEF